MCSGFFWVAPLGGLTRAKTTPPMCQKNPAEKQRLEKLGNCLSFFASSDDIDQDGDS